MPRVQPRGQMQENSQLDADILNQRRFQFLLEVEKKIGIVSFVPISCVEKFLGNFFQVAENFRFSRFLVERK